MLADQIFLRSAKWPQGSDGTDEVRTADIFSSCGAMSLGVWEACRAVGKRMKPVLAVDTDSTSLQVYEKNFPGVAIRESDIRALLDSELGAPPSEAEKKLVEYCGSIDFLLGGPPCQGHSDLNNHTRRTDPKNGLYERMARFAELVLPTHIIIENVPAVRHDRSNVLETTKAALKRVGYIVDDGVVEISSIGVAQRRRRHVLLASLSREIALDNIIARYRRPAPSLGWSISDLRAVGPARLFDRASTPGNRNRKRIEYLFKNRCYDLPDKMRPDCHRLKEHTYKSVYGRMDWDKPSHTITTGFGCMGQGRFVHPKEKRTITPHEAARIQFIPDFFSFDEAISRSALARMIGNAVPPKLVYVFALELLR